MNGKDSLPSRPQGTCSEETWRQYVGDCLSIIVTRARCEKHQTWLVRLTVALAIVAVASVGRLALAFLSVLP